GLDEGVGTVDRAIDMALGGEIHYIARTMLLEQRPQRRPVADVHLRKAITGILRLGYRAQAGGVGQLVDVEYTRTRVIQQVPDDGGADEAGAPRHKDHGILETHQLGSARRDLARERCTSKRYCP